MAAVCSPRSLELKFFSLVVTTLSTETQAQFPPAGPSWMCSTLINVIHMGAGVQWLQCFLLLRFNVTQLDRSPHGL